MVNIIESLKERRSYYNIGKELPVEENKVLELVEELTELVPDAFNMKSSRIVVVLGEKQDLLWDTIYDVFEGKVAREKIDSFRSGAGTILYFYDTKTVKGLQEKFPSYAANFPTWAQQSSAMLQISIWSGLRELGIGASLQHYNPVIDGKVRELFDLPASYFLVAQMPFGGIKQEPDAKEREDISKRVKIEK
ncbi:MAG TPA: nitroreductase family protein [Lachnospiraceae bacterium]|nr:nitroreductase family protein [Lachnospiraceae bacterium]